MASAGFQLPILSQPGYDWNYRDPSGNVNPWAFPSGAPNYVPAYDPNTMGVESDPTAMNAFRQEALRTGPSKYAQLSGAQQDALNLNAKSSAAGTSAGQTATANSNLAMTGGLDSGARERVQTNANKNLLDMNQKIDQTTANNKMQIGMNDEQNRVSQLSQVPGMQNQQNQASEFNINNAVNEGNSANLYKANIYNQQMKGWAAGQQSNATANSGGSWLCTEALDSGVDQKDWEPLLKLRRYATRRNSEVTRFYIFKCAPLIARMKKHGADFEKNKKFVKRVSELVREGNMDRAYRLYFKIVKELIKHYWPDCNDPVFLAEVK